MKSLAVYVSGLALAHGALASMAIERRGVASHSHDSRLTRQTADDDEYTTSWAGASRDGNFSEISSIITVPNIAFPHHAPKGELKGVPKDRFHSQVQMNTIVGLDIDSACELGSITAGIRMTASSNGTEYMMGVEWTGLHLATPYSWRIPVRPGDRIDTLIQVIDARNVNVTMQNLNRVGTSAGQAWSHYYKNMSPPLCQQSAFFGVTRSYGNHFLYEMAAFPTRPVIYENCTVSSYGSEEEQSLAGSMETGTGALGNATLVTMCSADRTTCPFVDCTLDSDVAMTCRNLYN